MLSHDQLFPLLADSMRAIGALMAEHSVAAVWVTNDPKVPGGCTAALQRGRGCVLAAATLQHAARCAYSS